MCEVIEKAKSLRGSEREVVADLIRELSVIYKERLFAEACYPSLFVFCTEGLGYSEGAAGAGWKQPKLYSLMALSMTNYDRASFRFAQQPRLLR